MYDCSKIDVEDGSYFLLVSLNRSFDQAKAKGVYKRFDVYESTRKYWAIGAEQAQKVNYVLGVYRKVVRCVIKVKSHEWVAKAEDGSIFKKPRCCFEGDLCPDSPYMNKDVSDYPFGSGAAVRYIK